MITTEKTNVMRLLEQKKISYTLHVCPDAQGKTGTQIAHELGQDPRTAFKTLVTCGSPRMYYVFVIPVEMELDLKKAAKQAGEKSIAMLPQKELLPLTGYVHGGCSPIGMKKHLHTWIHESARELPAMCVSAGKIGMQVELAPSKLAEMTGAKFADVAQPGS